MFENLTGIIIAFITGVVGPILVLYIKSKLEGKKEKPDMVKETLRVSELVTSKIEHIKELDFQELLDLCNMKFNNVLTFGQIDQTISTFHKDNHYHFVFICSNPK